MLGVETNTGLWMYKTAWKSVILWWVWLRRKRSWFQDWIIVPLVNTRFKERYSRDVIKLSTDAITRGRTSEEVYARRRFWLIPFVIASRFAICERRRLIFSYDVNESALKCVRLRSFAEVVSEPFSLCSPNAYKRASSVFHAIFVYR
jgi:hypothetical protein